VEKSIRNRGSERIFYRKQKCHSVDQIVFKLPRTDAELGKGKKISKVCKELEVTEQIYCRRWHK